MSVNIESYTQILEKTKKYKASCIAVSKLKPIEDIQLLFDAGQRDFAENYVQELTEKEQACNKNIHWHFIGHLQSNKVKPIASFVHLIQGVDSFKLLKEINKQANISGRIIDCLLQVHIAAEETKFGFDEAETEALLLFPELAELENIRLRGLMGMASFTEDKQVIRNEFTKLKNLFDNCRIMAFDHAAFSILSMGMTSDFEIALDCGSNMVRIGSAIFGERG